MPKQEEHEKPEDMVEESAALAEQAARSLQEAADSNETLQGYYSMNKSPAPPEVVEEADAERKKE